MITMATDLIKQIQQAVNVIVKDVPISVVTGINGHTTVLEITDVGIEASDANIFIGTESIQQANDLSKIHE